MSGESIGNQRLNPALVELDKLVGRWRVELFNAAFLPSPESRLRGESSIEWLGNAFVVMRSVMEGGPPESTLVIGRSEFAENYTVLYHDARGVSRIYKMTFDAGVWQMFRADPHFAQRFKGELSQDGHTITASWENSDDGNVWEHDFDLQYVRAGRGE